MAFRKQLQEKLGPHEPNEVSLKFLKITQKT